MYASEHPSSPQSDDDDTFPFRRVLSLTPLIDFWRGRALGSTLEADHARRILEALDEVAELLGPIDDPATVERHRPLIDEMLTAVFPRAQQDRTFAAVFPPYQLTPLFVTAAFEREGLSSALREWSRTPAAAASTLITAYHLVLERYYGVSAPIDTSFMLRSADAATGLDRYFRVSADHRFTRVELNGDLPPLAEEDIARLLADFTDLPLWNRLLPTERFQLRGILLVNAVEVTDQMAAAALTRDLLRPDAMASGAHFESLQRWVRTLLRQPALELGVLCLHHDDVDGISDAHPLGRSLLMSEGAAPECSFHAQSFYGRTITERHTITVRDMRDTGVRTGFEEHLLAQGLRNLMIAPLLADGRLVGLLELASPNPGELHALSRTKLEEVLALFATAVRRTLDEEETRIQAVIKQRYTAIHPSVEWRFRQAAVRYLQQQESGVAQPIEQIVFPDVYALYGLSDIRGSSAQRAEAIQQDLLEQLAGAKGVILAANRANPLPILSEIEHRISRYGQHVAERLNTGDEVRVHEFLRLELEPLLDQLRDFDVDVARAVAAYRAALDPQLGVLYRRRKDYEDSVTRINTAIANQLDEQEVHAQRMFPHYFEKYKTDGVDYNIYIGAALQEDGRFEPLFLRNLRLWQLMIMCSIVQRLEELEPRLPVPLEVAHLVLAQDAPLSIRFRTDEKRFDVDGAYNVRYEIVKKRIDKARVRGTREQLTQPGHIAIVYSQPKQAVEYRQYIEYLQSAGYLETGVEELELEDLQGVRGLAALRVTVARSKPEHRDDIATMAMVAASLGD